MFENIMWLAIGFTPTYLAMELSYRVAKRRFSKRNAVMVPQPVSVQQK
jgi:hypothetical protein